MYTITINQTNKTLDKIYTEDNVYDNAFSIAQKYMSDVIITNIVTGEQDVVTYEMELLF